MSVTTAEAESGLGVLQLEVDCDGGMDVAMAVAESLTAALAESKGAAVTLTPSVAAGEAVTRPVPTSVDSVDGDGAPLGDALPLDDGEGCTLLATDAVATTLAEEV